MKHNFDKFLGKQRTLERKYFGISEAKTHGYLILSTLQLACVPILRQTSPELVLFPEFSSFEFLGYFYHFKRKRKRSDSILRQTKNPRTNKIAIKKLNDNKKRNKMFDKTTIADRFRTISCSNYSHPLPLLIHVHVSQNDKAYWGWYTLYVMTSYIASHAQM